MTDGTPNPQPGNEPKPAPNPPTITLDTPGVRELIDREVAGLKSKNSDLLDKVNRLTSDKQALEESFQGFDPEKLTLLMKRFENDEEAKLIAEGKFDEVVARRLEAKSKPLEDQIAELQKVVAERDQTVAEREAKIETMIFDQMIREAASDEKLGIQPTAIPDVITRMRKVFTKFDDKGQPVADAYGKNGQFLRGVDGMKEWMETKLIKEAPHCFLPSKGGGVVGNVSDGVPAKNPFARDTYNLNEATRLWRENPDLARRLQAEAEPGRA
jgi:hypothetical protein